MTLREQLTRDGFDPVPRDDRLFDVFPHLTRHRGIELWEKWTETEVQFAYFKFQLHRPKLQTQVFSHRKLEEALLSNQNTTFLEAQDRYEDNHP